LVHSQGKVVFMYYQAIVNYLDIWFLFFFTVPNEGYVRNVLRMHQQYCLCIANKPRLSLIKADTLNFTWENYFVWRTNEDFTFPCERSKSCVIPSTNILLYTVTLNKIVICTKCFKSIKYLLFVVNHY
jgi:hypothetical protein